MIVVISGTNRSGSNTLKVARRIHDIHSGFGETRLIDLAEMPPSLYSPDAYAAKPDEFKPFSDAILASAGLVVVTPEYNGGVPGALKYFIDMLKFPESFDRRPVAFVGLAAGAWGGLRPVEHLQQIFGYRNAHIFPERVFIPFVVEALDETGQISKDDIDKRLQRQAQGFARFVKQLSAE